jgi:hypothetical protein
MQTEGDAERAKQTYARLGNTTRANDFILDMAQAVKEREATKASFYTEALPIANNKGQPSLVKQEWNKVDKSIWDNPIMQKWKK